MYFPYKGVRAIERPIGFFDSGVGGVSVLRAARRLMPEEDYIYFGDSAHAPYGGKSQAQVQALTLAGVAFLLDKGGKAVVIACNTATSAAIKAVRAQYPALVIVGLEPAVKPAVEKLAAEKVLVLATTATLAGEKFRQLADAFQATAQIIPLPCPGLMELIERGETTGPRVEALLRDKLAQAGSLEKAAVVLGCTHYPFIRPALAALLPAGVPIIDGSEGAAHQLARLLAQRGLRKAGGQGAVAFFNSDAQAARLNALCRTLLVLPE